MKINHLSILNYRNIAEAEIDLSPGINLFAGGNGQGKTNVLDAVYFLSMAKSSLAQQDAGCLRHGEAFFIVEGRYEHDDQRPEVITASLKTGHGKTLLRAKKAYRRVAEHIGLIPLVMVSPADQMLLLTQSDERRRFLDIVISQADPTYLTALLAYNKALTQRNALLRQDDDPDPELLRAWEQAMGHEGNIIAQAREQFVRQAEPLFQQFYAQIAPQGETVGLAYVSHAQRGDLAEVISQGRAKDRAVGYSLHGIHRDDIEMTLGGHQLRREASQGQAKTYVIALKLAWHQVLRQITGTAPILLLDDIFDKLDRQRVERILQLADSHQFGQTLITTTSPEGFEAARVFRVENGTIR